MAQVKNGRWRLLWFGSLRVAPSNPVGYEAKAYFEWAASGQRNLETCWLPLSTLPVLRIQSVWENRAFSGFGHGQVRTFQVKTDGADLRPPWVPGHPALDLLKRDEYRFYGKQDLAPCWTFSTATREGLVVPVCEVLRAWYLFDPAVMPSVLAGLRHAHTLRREFRPWLDGTGIDPDGRCQFVAPKWLSNRQAKRVARLLFDPVASERAYGIYRTLMDAGCTPNREQELPWPAILPPYEGIATWTVSCRPLSPTAEGIPQWLVLNLLGADLPATLPEIAFVRENDSRQGANHGDSALPATRWRRAMRAAPAVRENLKVTDGAPDPDIETALLDGFDFQDNIDDTLELCLVDKPLQVSRSIHAATASEEPLAGATDHAGPRRTGHAKVTVVGEDEALPAVDLLRRTLEAFQVLVNDSQAQSATAPSWAARLLTWSAPDTVRVSPERKCKVRHFAVLEGRFMDRYVYALDAQRTGSERFRIMLCCSRAGLPCSAYLFRSWLTHFPATSGCPWTGCGIAPRVLRCKGLNHQPDRDGLTPSEVTAQLADRLKRELAKFAHEI